MRAIRFGIVVAVALIVVPNWPGFAQQRRVSHPPFSPTQTVPIAAPPFAGISGLQGRWDYSDLVCVGSAEAAIRTGVIENLGGSDRDQLSSRVALDNCLKGRVPAGTITVLGDSVFAEKEIHGGYGYSGPRPGFLSRGRNLLFLRYTEDPTVWRVTVPVYATCIPLADDAPSYPLDTSPQSVRSALVVELESAIEQGHRDLDNSTYVEYIWEILGSDQGIIELKSFMALSSWTTRQDIALSMLNQGYSDGADEAIALLEDNASEPR